MQERSCGSVGAALTGFAEMAPCLILLALSLILLAPCFLLGYLLFALLLLATCSSCCWCPGSVSPPFLPFPLFWFDWARVQVLGKWIPIIPSMLFAGHTRLEMVMSLDTDVCNKNGCVLLIIAFCVVILSELKETENIWNFPELKIQSQFSSFWWLYQPLLRCSRWMRIPISKFHCFNGKVLVLDL